MRNPPQRAAPIASMPFGHRNTTRRISFPLRTVLKCPSEYCPSCFHVRPNPSCCQMHLPASSYYLAPQTHPLWTSLHVGPCLQAGLGSPTGSSLLRFHSEPTSPSSLSPPTLRRLKPHSHGRFGRAWLIPFETKRLWEPPLPVSCPTIPNGATPPLGFDPPYGGSPPVTLSTP